VAAKQHFIANEVAIAAIREALNQGWQYQRSGQMAAAEHTY